MGRGRGRKGGRGEGRFEDQYGEAMVGQDRAEHFGFAGRGSSSKGGDAGSRSKPGNDVAFIRHVPKFLQSHAHLLGKPAEEEPEAALLGQKFGDGGGVQEDEAEDDDDQEALRRAIEQDPSLVQQHPELQTVADKSEAEAVKAKGNVAFSSGNYEAAVRLFGRCIELDGGNHIYYSNRAAAHSALQNYAAAVQDAQQCTQLKPSWAKGWSRLGAAYFGQGDFAEAREAYQRACDLEPNDTQLQLALQKAAAREAKEVAEGRHKFKRKLTAAQEEREDKRQQTVRPTAAKKEKKLLSFGDDEGEEEA